MTGFVRFFLPICTLLSLSGCMQRTVTETGSRISFSNGWSSQLGDTDEIKKRFASGFEIKDGLAVAAGETKGFDPKTLQMKSIQQKTFELKGTVPDAKKPFAGTSAFSQTPEFKTSTLQAPLKEFPTGSARGIDMNKVVPTEISAANGKPFPGSSKVAREGGLREFFGGNRSARENAARTTAARADLVQDERSGRLVPVESSLTEAQVRDILHPGG